MQYSIILTVLFFLVGCNSPSTTQTVKSEVIPQSSELTGKVVFKQYCVLCHGADGKLGLNGSKDLTLSDLPLDSVLYQIKNGKGTMLPYKDILNDAEIDSVTQYVISLRINE